MKSPWSKIVEVAGAVLADGIRAILITALLEFIVVAVALVLGLVFWLRESFLAGLGAGLTTMILGQVIVVMVLDSMEFLELAKKPRDRPRSDDELLRALREELKEAPHNPRPPEGPTA